MALTAAEVRNARKGEKPYKLADGGGLYLYVTPTGARSWRMKYRFGGKEKLLTFGLASDVGLAEVRAMREAAKELLRQGKDPGVERGRQKDEAEVSRKRTFEPIARDWHEAERPRWSPGQAALVLRALERDVLPVLGDRPVADITGPDIIAMLRKIEARGSIETAKRVRGYVSGAFKRAKAESFVAVNPAADIADALRRTVKGAKQPAIVDPEGLIALQQSIDRSTSGPAVKLASRLLALTVVRIGVLRAATWDEFTGIDWDDPDAPAPAALWRISAERMKLEVEEKGKAGYDHDVPLPPEAVAVLRAMRVLTGRGRFIFPSQRTTREPMSDAALSTLYKRRGYRGKHVPHGWRAAFSTIMNERAVEMDREGDRLVLDLMLAHAPKGMSASEFAYNRARYSTRRRELASAWAALITPGLDEPFELLRGQAR
ncbi:tyrosine-type recombinase/integrase [Sphingomonas sp. 10B4]|uniref:tyrosine-type recombinase/integrase n=1 Tax=Sphingomonas sp. 10B4 TaxID=3048575 RepID=UPI002AB46E02|nr:integrase arm-type DNA-binding domain-containing protein [Sphingomonas sp. 10B4]MDY7525377.1 integrase arm-type DNA-binding domain-containing protein [Sphingomonas sp. 10B4]MEB0282896.1 integrase arm-type DNA-binding domain-containing protein [Sphingomonas sp. 10B4]